jgi:hypothetical protein
MSRHSPPFTESEVNFPAHNSQPLHPLLQHKSPLHIGSDTTLTKLRVDSRIRKMLRSRPGRDVSTVKCVKTGPEYANTPVPSECQSTLPQP